MTLITERRILRRWKDSDAENLYEYAKDPDVGPIAGWPAHQSIEESRDVIKNVFSSKEAYAICLKTDNRAIGAIELKLNGHTDMTDRDDECEIAPKHQKAETSGALEDAMVLRVIEILKEQPDISQGALGERIGITHRVVQKCINVLKESGGASRYTMTGICSSI